MRLAAGARQPWRTLREQSRVQGHVLCTTGTKRLEAWGVRILALGRCWL